IPRSPSPSRAELRAPRKKQRSPTRAKQGVSVALPSVAAMPVTGSRFRSCDWRSVATSAHSSSSDSLTALAVEFPVNLPNHGLEVQGKLQKLGKFFRDLFGPAQQAVVVHPHYFYVGLAIQPCIDL